MILPFPRGEAAKIMRKKLRKEGWKRSREDRRSREGRERAQGGLSEQERESLPCIFLTLPITSVIQP